MKSINIFMEGINIFRRQLNVNDGSLLMVIFSSSNRLSMHLGWVSVVLPDLSELLFIVPTNICGSLGIYGTIKNRIIQQA